MKSFVGFQADWPIVNVNTSVQSAHCVPCTDKQCLWQCPSFPLAIAEANTMNASRILFAGVHRISELLSLTADYASIEGTAAGTAVLDGGDSTPILHITTHWYHRGRKRSSR